MVRKEIVGNELYVYVNHRLIYKRWLDTGNEKVFHENEGLSQFCNKDVINAWWWHRYRLQRLWLNGEIPMLAPL